MGLNVGIKVKQQSEGFMQLGCNPKGTLEEITDDVIRYVEDKVPNVSIHDEGDFAYSVNDVRLYEGWYDFDIRVRSYGGNMVDRSTKLIQALCCYAVEHFSSDEGIEIRTYWVR